MHIIFALKELNTPLDDRRGLELQQFYHRGGNDPGRPAAAPTKAGIRKAVFLELAVGDSGQSIPPHYSTVKFVELQTVRVAQPGRTTADAGQ
jgi:hypothetical protein